MTVSGPADPCAPYLTMPRGALRLAAHVLSRDVAMLSCCAAWPARRRDFLMTQPGKPGWIGSASRQAALPGPLRELHRAVLRRFLATGDPPAAGWIAGAAAGLGLGDSAVAELEAADLVHAANGVAAVAYPFAGTPTGQQVELDGFPAVYAMCAIDALGIPAMAGRDGRITATDPRDGAPVVVSVRGGQWRWAPATSVVVFGSTRDCGTDCQSWQVMCPNTTFHASRDSARAYLAARSDIDGQILDQDAAVERGRRNFGPLLGGTA